MVGINVGALSPSSPDPRSTDPSPSPSPSPSPIPSPSRALALGLLRQGRPGVQRSTFSGQGFARQSKEGPRPCLLRCLQSHGVLLAQAAVRNEKALTVLAYGGRTVISFSMCLRKSGLACNTASKRGNFFISLCF